MNFAHRSTIVRLFLAAATIGLTACTQNFAPSKTTTAATPSYERIIARLEDADTLSFREPGAFAYFVPGDVITARYQFAADKRERRVRDGDVLQLDVPERADLSNRHVEVQADGQISLPLLGRILAAGDTLERLTSRVGFLYRLADVETPAINFSFLTAGSVGPLTISETVEKVAVSSDLQINLRSIDAVDASREPDAVWSDIRRAYQDRFGDEIDVAVRRSHVAPRNVYVVGEVGRAGRVPLRPHMSARIAVAAAGGLGAAADPRRLVLMRLMPDKRFRYGTFSLGSSTTNQRSKNASIQLLPNDVVLVPDGRTDEINVSIAAAATSTLPMDLRRELGLLATPLAGVGSSSRSLSCVPDVEARNRDLGSALAIQLRSPVLSKNYVWTMEEHFEQQRYLAAERLAAVSLSLREDLPGQNDLSVAQALNTLGLTYDVQGRHADAEALYARALLILEDVLGPFDPVVASTIENLASVYVAECRYDEAKLLHQRALVIRETVQGPGHPDLTRSLANYAKFEQRVAALGVRDVEGSTNRVRQRR